MVYFCQLLFMQTMTQNFLVRHCLYDVKTGRRHFSFTRRTLVWSPRIQPTLWKFTCIFHFKRVRKKGEKFEKINDRIDLNSDITSFSPVAALGVVGAIQASYIHQREISMFSVFWQQKEYQDISCCN